jgi:coniferyl-aldehyde dehydrogenase
MYPQYIGHKDATSTINAYHYSRILGYVEEAESAGCEVISLNGDEPNPETRQIPMYIVIEPDESLSVMKEEIFGPVTAVKTYTTVDEAIGYINKRNRPLAAYLAGREKSIIEKFQNNVISGGIGINTFGLQAADPSLPFGGIGASGMGCHSGLEGFLNFTHSKSVFECSDDNVLMSALKAPYGELTQQIVDAIYE